MSDPFTMLDNEDVVYKKLHLSETPKTAEDVERIYDTPISNVLKTIIFMNSKPIVTVLPGNKTVDKQQLSSVVDVENPQLASPEEVLHMTGTEIGSLDPFVRPKDCVSILDSSIKSCDVVNMGGGKPGIGIEMSTEELLDVWDGIIANIT